MINENQMLLLLLLWIPFRLQIVHSVNVLIIMI